MDKVVVLTTSPGQEQAESLAAALLESRLAACVQTLPGLVSFYRWQGRMERASEVLLIIKTVRARLPELIATVERLHPYEIPEVLALPVAAGLPTYLRWLEEETKETDATEPHPL